MKNILFDNTFLSKDKRKSSLKADVSTANSTFLVFNNIGFSTGQAILIGRFGDEDSEILIGHTTTGSSGLKITLQGSFSISHNQDTEVTILDWDLVEISHATTKAGTKSVLQTIVIDPSGFDTLYKDTAKTTGFYFSRHSLSVDATYGDYSDPIPYSGYTDNTVYSVKKRALNSCGEKIGALITDDFLNEVLWEARREVHKMPGKRPFRRKMNVDIGNVTAGQFRVKLPSDVEKPYTAENVYGVRFGTNKNMRYYDKKDWDEDYQGVAHSILTSAYVTTDGILRLEDVRDFDDSGSVTIEEDSIVYSAKNNSTGTIKITTAGNVNHDNLLEVWQNASYGLPDYFTVFIDAVGSAFIAFNRPAGTNYAALNIWGDYYSTMPAMDSDADEFDEPEYDMYVNYLAWRIKKFKNKGLKALDDDDHLEWQRKKGLATQNQYVGDFIRFEPGIEHLE